MHLAQNGLANWESGSWSGEIGMEYGKERKEKRKKKPYTKSDTKQKIQTIISKWSHKCLEESTVNWFIVQTRIQPEFEDCLDTHKLVYRL